MRALYRLQSRLGLTAPEGNALLALALAGLLGVGALEWQERSGVPSETLYTAADSAFAAASRGAPPAAQMLMAAPEMVLMAAPGARTGFDVGDTLTPKEAGPASQWPQMLPGRADYRALRIRETVRWAAPLSW